ncbi:MAG: tyrosine-type recombinase/integrase [Proteobacteria bacterium]|nr:tyrosine-type recombinase/integrase [Pseudomonadota bacterium]
MSQRKRKSKRRERNPENLYERAGIWWIRYKTGNRLVRRSLGTTSLREAKRMRDQILAKRTTAAKFGLETQAAEPCMTFAEIAEKWLKSRLADESLAPQTRLHNTHIIKNHLTPCFGSIAMSSITVEDVESFIAGLRKRYKRSTVAAYYGCFRNIISQAIRRGWYVGANPLDRLDRVPTEGPGRETILTIDEASGLIAGLSGRLYYKSAIALKTGLRWGEIHGLGWAEIALDIEHPTLTVCRSYRGKPKNEASAATIPIGNESVALLRDWRARQKKSTPWVFPGNHGQILASNPSLEGIKIHKAAERAGIQKHVTPHVFRHTFGTWVYERTGDPKIVQRLMRHASFKSSMRYVHDHRELAPVMNELPSII